MNLVLGVYGQVKAQSGLMSEIVREVPGAVKHKHRLKRFWRFLSNPRVRPEGLRLFWVAWCIKTFCHDRIVKVAMDWTTLPGNSQCLMIALPIHGRAIPLLWQLVYVADIKDSQNLIEERLMTQLVHLIRQGAPQKQLVLTADRGFGRALFFQFLLKKKVLFAIRVKSDVRIQRGGKTIMLRTLGKTLTENMPLWYERISYRTDGIVGGINMAAVVATPEEGKEPDPWFLITNLATVDETISRYQERFHIEEWFKDMKHQLGIANIQTRNLMRVRRLLFLSCIAYGMLMIVGSVADSLTTMKDTLITGGSKAASMIWFALKGIKHNLPGKTFWNNVAEMAIGP